MKSVTGPLEESVEALRSKVKDRKKIDLANGEHWACLRLVRRLSVRLLVSARIWPKTLLILISTDRHWYLWEKLMTSFTFSMVLDLDHNTSYLGPWLWYNMIYTLLFEHWQTSNRHPLSDFVRLQGFSDVFGSAEVKKVRGAGAESTANELNMCFISKKDAGKNHGTYTII